MSLLLTLGAPALAAEDFSAAAAAVGPSTAVLTVTLASGGTSNATGFVAGGGRLLVTNHHAVVDAAAVLCDFGATGAVTAEGLLALDPDGDLAVLALPAPRPTLVLAPTTPQPGSPVMAVGNPHGLGMTFTDGIVSAVRSLDGYAVVQHSAPISPGNSGGPLVDPLGRVVGVNSFFWAREYSQNLNFAVGSAHLGPALEAAAEALAAGALLPYPTRAASPAYLSLEDQAGPQAPQELPPPVFEVLPYDAPPRSDDAITDFVASHPALRDQETLETYLATAREVTAAAEPQTPAALEALLEEAWRRTVADRERLYGLDGLLVGMPMAGVEAVLGTALTALPAERCAAFTADASCYVHAAPTEAESSHNLRTLYHADAERLTGAVLVMSGRSYADVVAAYTAELGEPPDEAAAVDALQASGWDRVGLTVIAGDDAQLVLVHHGGFNPR